MPRRRHRSRVAAARIAGPLIRFVTLIRFVIGVNLSYNYDPELVPLALAFPETDITDLGRARELLRQQQPPFTAPESLRIEKRTVPGPPGDPDVEVCIMTPRDLTAP